MPSLNLTYNDKMNMASSVEVRVPLFLNRDLAEFVATIFLQVEAEGVLQAFDQAYLAKGHERRSAK